jgi:hypothetical protein
MKKTIDLKISIGMAHTIMHYLEKYVKDETTAEIFRSAVEAAEKENA